MSEEWQCERCVPGVTAVMGKSRNTVSANE